VFAIPIAINAFTISENMVTVWVSVQYMGIFRAEM